MKNSYTKLIESDFMKSWEEKEQRKKREFMDHMIHEKERLEKTVFFTLDIEDDLIESISTQNNDFQVNPQDINPNTQIERADSNHFYRYSLDPGAI